MPIRILIHPGGRIAKYWLEAFNGLDDDIDARVWPNWGSVDDGPAYALVWHPNEGIIAKQTNIKAIFSMGAGTDGIQSDSSLPEYIPVYRLADQALADDMAAYVTMAVLMMQRRMPEFISQQTDNNWQQHWNKPAKDHRVGIMGYGKLGKAAAKQLKPFGFPLAGWCRRERAEDANGVSLFFGGNQLDAFLARSDILVCMLPHTKATSGLMNLKKLNLLPKGASVINVGRGSLICLKSLEKALDGPLRSAMLDVMPEEPFPSTHPFWQREDVIITPHIASITRPPSAAAFIVDSIHALEGGETLAPQLDRSFGY